MLRLAADRSSACTSCVCGLPELGRLAHAPKCVWELWRRVKRVSALKPVIVAFTAWVSISVHKPIVTRKHLIVLGHEVIIAWIAPGIVGACTTGLGGRNVVRTISSAFIEREHRVRAGDTKTIYDNGKFAEEVDNALAALR